MSYQRDGYVSPIRVLDEPEVALFRKRTRTTSVGGERLAAMPPRDRYVFFAETHAYLPWVFDWPRDRACSTRLPGSSARIS